MKKDFKKKSKEDLDSSNDFRSLIKVLNQKKNNSINDLENLKKQFVFKINLRLDKLYSKADFIRNIKLNKTKLKKFRIGVWTKIITVNIFTTLKYIFSMPFIYGMLIPGFILHLFLEIYHQVCFRIYGIPLVKAKDFFVFDRRHLPYLNWLEKFNCFYCSYYNCLVSYLQEIVGRTERYWCPIKHAMRMSNTHAYYTSFMDYSGDKDFRQNWKKLREFEEFKKSN